MRVDEQMWAGQGGEVCGLCAYNQMPACAGQQCGCCQGSPTPTVYSGKDWEEYVQTTVEGQTFHRYWADWVPTAEGQQWCSNKRYEARLVVNGMINQWGLDALRAGEGVIDVCGDPGFFAAECLASGIQVTVIDPAFGSSGKSDRQTVDYINDQAHWQRVRHGAVPYRLIREPFTPTLVDDPQYSQLFRGASAIVSFYPDEATDFVLSYTAANALRTVIIPCNECRQYFPKHDPTYEGFVRQLLQNDQYNLQSAKQYAPLQRAQLWGSPFCQVLLTRTPIDRPLPW